MTSLSPAQFKAMHAKLMDPNEGGFSVSAATGRAPKVGYMVSIPGAEQQIRSENVAPAHIEEFVKKHGAELSQPGAHVGGWNNRASGEVSLDVSMRYKGTRKVARQYGAAVADADARTTASDMAIAHNQEAGYDLKRGKDIPNPGYVPRR